MKKLIYLCIFFVFNSQIVSCPHCLDDSWHLERPFDNKEYHPVECNCPCRKLNIARGECTECGHKHYFAPQVIIRRPQPHKTVTGWRKIPSHICQ